MMTQDEIFLIFKEQVNQILPHIPSEKITADNSLKDLGANSIDRSDIIISTLAALNLKVSLTQFASAKNMGELVELISIQQV